MRDMASKWDHPPPLCALTGTEDFLLRSEIREAKSRAILQGRRVVEDSSGKVLDRIFTESVWSTDSYLVFFHGNDFDEKKLFNHWEKQDSQIAVVLIPGKTKPKILKKLPQSLIAKFESPKPWDREDWTIKLLDQMARERGIKLSESQEKLLVKVLGNQDLGILDWQLWKLQKLLASRENSQVQLEDIKGTLIDISSVGDTPLIKQVGYRKADQIPFFVKKAKDSCPSIFAVLAFLTRNLRTWIQVKAMEQKDIEEISNRVGLNKYIVKTEILPITARWKMEDLVSLFQEVSKVRRGAKRGSVDPWIDLEATLMLHILDPQ